MATPKWAEFYITDGTTEVDMLDYFYMINWRPRITQYKDGGVYRDSPLSDGRTMAYRRYGNVGEAIQFHARATNPDSLAGALRRLRNLLESAAAYWFTDHQSAFVYIGARAEGESKTRYVILVAATVPEDDDPYSSEVFDCEYVLAKGLTLAFERLPFWLLEVPSEEMAVELSALQAYNSINFGNVDWNGARVPTTAAEVFFRNGHAQANITHIFIDDGGSFSSNQISQTADFPLLPDDPVEDDAVYFGCQTSLDDSGPFSNLVFDIGTGAFQLLVAWEFWNGSAWTAFDAAMPILDVFDGTSSFTLTGVNSVVWMDTETWAANAINGVTAYWVRARVTTIGVNPTPPIQQNRLPYSVVWPYVEVQSDQLVGDVPAVLRLKIFNKSCVDVNREPQLYADHIIIGARSVERGANFTPYLNIANTQNISGIAAAAGVNGSFVAEKDYSMTGIVGRWLPTGEVTTPEAAFRITLDSTIANEYAGRYHAYLRVHLTVGATPADVSAGIRISAFAAASNLYFDTEFQPCRITGFDPIILDLGRVSLPPGGIKPGETISQIYFDIRAKCAIATGCTLDFYELILMPIDEWLGSYEEAAIITDTNILHAENYLDIDGITYPRDPFYAPVRTVANGNLEVTYRPTSITPPQIAPGIRTRLFFLAERSESWLVNTKHAVTQTLFAVQMGATQRFLSSIGDE
jgi:hypothetical protein